MENKDGALDNIAIRSAFLSSANIERRPYIKAVIDAMEDVVKNTIEEHLQDLTEGNNSYELDLAEVDYLCDMALADMGFAVCGCSPDEFDQQVSQEFQNMDKEQKRYLLASFLEIEAQGKCVFPVITPKDDRELDSLVYD